MSYVPAELRDLVVQRADGRCEYCRFPQDASFFTFEMEHIIAEKHGGATDADNLALACPYCNRAKGTDIASLDPESGELTPLVNPRVQEWDHHFRLADTEIVPLTPVGRVTTSLLQLNDPDRIRERERLIAIGRYP